MATHYTEMITSASKAEKLADRKKQQAKNAASKPEAREKLKSALGLLRRALYLTRGHNNRDRIKADIDRVKDQIASLKD